MDHSISFHNSDVECHNSDVECHNSDVECHNSDVECHNSDVECPMPMTDTTIISHLQQGDIVQLNYIDTNNDRLSHYSNIIENTSKLNVDLIIDSINADASFYKNNGIYVLLLRDTTIPQEQHQYAWVLTSDGYIRECEHYIIQGYISYMSVRV